MGKKNFFKAIAFSMVITIIWSIVSFLFNIDTITSYILLVIFVTLVVIYFTLKNLRYLKTLLNNGRYDELIKYMSNSHKILKRIWDIKNSILLT